VVFVSIGVIDSGARARGTLPLAVRSSELTPALGAWSAWHEAGPIRLGISSCLLGEQVRFDGGHKRDRFLTDELGPWVEWVGVCPEVELGMGVPRPSVRLVEQDGVVRLVSPATGEDFSARMRAYARKRVAELQELELDGYVLKKNSPSCGLLRLKVYGAASGGMPVRRDGSGLFAQVLQEAWPHLPLEEEGRLGDAKIRENFVERIFCRNRWRTFVRRGRSRRRLVEFWTAHKMLVRAHDEQAYQRLGRLVGSAGKGEGAEHYERFEREFFAALAAQATRRRHANVLQHALGYLRELLEPVERAQLASSIDDYRRGLLPLVVPLALLRFQIRKHGVVYLAAQLYFDPHPKELMIRNHV
jgi:uncharacterized protein YbgA (DUF1722 family)/uncharacterized protein YbbK (DUF523 family)